MIVKEINGIPVLLGGERIARYKRGKKPKPPMAEFGIAKIRPQHKLTLKNKLELGMFTARLLSRPVMPNRMPLTSFPASSSERRSRTRSRPGG